jgi:hypothetical protein
METQTETPNKSTTQKEVEIIECLEFKSADIKSIVKSEKLYNALRYLQPRLETDYGNKIYICRGKNAIVIKGYYIISTHVDLCVNACLYVAQDKCENMSNPLHHCQDACWKFVEPYSHVVLVENYRRLVYELTYYGVEFSTKFRDKAFEIVIES